MLRPLIPLGLITSMLLVPAGAMAATVSGSGVDRRGDGPKRGDIVRVTATYNSDDGTIKSRVTFARRGARVSNLFSYFGKHDGKRCNVSNAGVLGYDLAKHEGFVGLIPSQGAAGTATVKVVGRAITFLGTASVLVNQGFDCVTVVLGRFTTPARIFDRMSVRLKPR